MSRRKIEIVGAGPAGLGAALAARATGADVLVYEKRRDVGARFHGDFQGLENWTTDTDVLSELAGFGIETTFDHTPVCEIVCFDPDGIPHEMRSSSPVFYLVRRGSEPGTLDHALKTQALNAGIEIRFGNRHRHMPNGGIVAEGPHRADVIASGYVFETDMANGCYAAVADRLAPAGYSYLLIDRGRGTLATCVFKHFHNERRYLENTVEFFQQAVGLRWKNARRFGGSGNYDRVQNPLISNRSYVGEAAGFQDALFGFGLRHALTSGYLAGASDEAWTHYESQWRARLGGLNAVSIVNRWLYAWLGDRGRRVVLRRFAAGQDPRRLLQRIYAPSRLKTTIAKWIPRKPLWRTERIRGGCDCAWCRGHRDKRDTSRGSA